MAMAILPQIAMGRRGSQQHWLATQDLAFSGSILSIEFSRPSRIMPFDEIGQPIVFFDEDFLPELKIFYAQIMRFIEGINLQAVIHFPCPRFQFLHGRDREIGVEPYRCIGSALFHRGGMFLSKCVG